MPDAAKIEANGSQTLLTNWPGYHSYYHGIEASLVKRLSGRWMARVSASYNEAREDYGDDPLNYAGNPTRTDLSPLVNGGQYAVQSAGSGMSDVFMNAKWQVSASGAYLFPGDLEAGASIFGRQGYPFVIFRSADLGYDAANVLIPARVDSYRLDDLWDVDLRVSKTFRVSRVGFQVVADLFNVLNELMRNRNLDSPNFRRLAQNLSPRILRFGARLTF